MILRVNPRRWSSILMRFGGGCETVELSVDAAAYVRFRDCGVEDEMGVDLRV